MSDRRGRNRDSVDEVVGFILAVVGGPAIVIAAAFVVFAIARSVGVIP